MVGFGLSVTSFLLLIAAVAAFCPKVPTKWCTVPLSLRPDLTIYTIPLHQESILLSAVLVAGFLLMTYVGIRIDTKPKE